jgi:hypothetical protein
MQIKSVLQPTKGEQLVASCCIALGCYNLFGSSTTQTSFQFAITNLIEQSK